MKGEHVGRYVECDERGCKATFSLDLTWSKDRQTLHEARQAGWFIESKSAGFRVDRHFCPIHHPQDVD
jgi:hypothetical protein